MKLQTKTLLATLYFFLFGISIGTFIATSLSPEEKGRLLSHLTGRVLSGHGFDGQSSSVFLHSVANNLGSLALIALAGITVWGFPAAIISVTYKGIALGFTSAFILELFPEKGLLLVLLSMIPQNFLIVPALLVASQQALSLAITAFSDPTVGIRKSLTAHVGSYFFIQFWLSVAILLGCVIESFLFPSLVPLIKWQ